MQNMLIHLICFLNSWNVLVVARNAHLHPISFASSPLVYAFAFYSLISYPITALDEVLFFRLGFVASVVYKITMLLSRGAATAIVMTMVSVKISL